MGLGLVSPSSRLDLPMGHGTHDSDVQIRSMSTEFMQLYCSFLASLVVSPWTSTSSIFIPILVLRKTVINRDPTDHQHSWDEVR